MLHALLLSAVLVGASAEIRETVVVNVPADALAAWLQQNPGAVVRAAGSEVLWRKGPQTAVRKRTSRGTVELVLQETIGGQPGDYTYTCRLVKASPAVVRDYRVQARLTAVDATRSQLAIYGHAVVAVPRMSDAEVRGHLAQSIRGVVSLIQQLR